MKRKLIFLLLLCYCLGNVSTVLPAQLRAARAAAVEQPVTTAKKSKSKKKAKEYSYKIGKKAPILLSEIFEELGLKTKVSAVKEIKPASSKVKKLVSCTASKEHKGDYEIDVLKDFKEAKLNIKTKKSSFVLVLKKGVKSGGEEAAANEAGEEAVTEAETVSAPKANAPAEETEKPAEEQQEPAEEKQEPAEEKQEPAGETQESSGEAQEPADQSGETADDEKETSDDKQEADQSQESGAGETPSDAPTDGGDGSAGETQPQEGAADAAEGETAAEPQEGSTDAPQEGSTDAPQEGTADAPQEGSTDAPQDGTADEPQEGAADESQEGVGEDASTGDEAGAKLPKDAEAWFERDGVKLGGTLEETIALLEGGEKVYIRAKKAILVKDAPLKALSNVEFLPDGDVFEGDYAVNISRDDPDAVAEPELVEAKALKELGDKADLYIWVAEAKADDPQEPEKDDPAQDEEEKPAIVVQAENYAEATWTCLTPDFTLSGIPEGKTDWSYAAIVYDERIVPLSESAFTPVEEGQYTVRFAIVDGIGDILSTSELYTLWLDWTAPELTVEVDTDKSYTMYVSATDERSFVEAVSVDGGKTWHPVGDGEDYVYKGKKKKKFAAGTIMARDIAGNIVASELDYTVDKAVDEDDNGGFGGFGGGGSGGDGTKKAVHSHASGDGEETPDYDALELELPLEPMKRLTVGGEAMDLTLVLAAAQEPEAPVGENQSFTASLFRWDKTHSGEEEPQPDTLLLTAEPEPNLGDRFTYEWHFNGEVYRMLANSGIRYMALKVGDEVAAFPTEGFTGGTKFTELKMLGVSTRKFDYTLSMKVNMDPGYVSAMSDNDYSQSCDLAINTVVENMAYELSSATNSIMYFYDVYLGPEDMLNQPFGEYRAQ